MKLPSSLAIITALLHNLLLMVSPADHTIVSKNSTVGFSFGLVTYNKGLYYSIQRGSDGFLHLHHNLCTDPLSSGPNCSLSYITALSQEIITSVDTLHALLVRLGTDIHQYTLKVDTSGSLTWLQCKPCEPQAPQYNPIFNPAASTSFHNVKGTSHICQPPFRSTPSGTQCYFHLTN